MSLIFKYDDTLDITTYSEFRQYIGISSDISTLSVVPYGDSTITCIQDTNHRDFGRWLKYSERFNELLSNISESKSIKLSKLLNINIYQIFRIKESLFINGYFGNINMTFILYGCVTNSYGITYSYFNKNCDEILVFDKGITVFVRELLNPTKPHDSLHYFWNDYINRLRQFNNITEDQLLRLRKLKLKYEQVFLEEV